MKMPVLTDEFPILNIPENGQRLVYLDNAATVQRPLCVLESVQDFYHHDNANPHRGVYELAQRATDIHENARASVARFIHAPASDGIIFTQNCSESLNLVAYGFGMTHIKQGDEIVISVSEHHSNLVPWQRVARERGAVIKYLYPDEHGFYTEEEIAAKITSRTRIVAIAHVSNVLGLVNPIETVVSYAHKNGAVVVLDCAQSIPHMRIDVQALDVDFAAFSGHKMYAPMGIGVLYGKRSVLEKTEPLLSGGDMISQVHEQSYSFAEIPRKFETGTRNVGGEAGLAAAIDLIGRIGYDALENHEDRLMELAVRGLSEIEHITIYGDISAKTLKEHKRKGVISFNIDDVHPHDVATILDSDGITIRAGHHCAQPLMEYLKCGSCCRASFAVYNTEEDVSLFLESVRNVRRLMGFGS